MEQTTSKKVTLYCTSTCPFCVSAKRLLEQRGVPFVEIDLTGDSELRAEISRKTGMRTVPVVMIGEECVGGYTELAALDASGELQSKLS